MLSNTAQDYVAAMLDAYLEDETTTFKMKDIGLNPTVWAEIENASIVDTFRQLGVVQFNPDAVLRDAFPDKE